MKASWILDVTLPTVIQTSGVQNLLAHNVMARTSSISIAVRCDKCSKCGKNRSKQRKQNSIKKYFLALFNAATFVTHQSRAKSLHHRQLGGKIALKACGMETKATIPLLSAFPSCFAPIFRFLSFFVFFLFSGRVLLCYPKRIFHLAGSFAGSSLLRRALFASVFRAGQSRIWPKPSPGPSWPKLAQTGR